MHPCCHPVLALPPPTLHPHFAQVLGLTATPANADTVEQTHSKLDALCKNMDARIVQVTEHAQSLEEHSNSPEMARHFLQ